METVKQISKYKCRNCKYTFRFKHGKGISLRCPNCGKSDLIEDKFDINRVIQESGSSAYDF